MEVWKPVEGYEGRYEVSSEGRARNVKTGRVLSAPVAKNGYRYFNVYKTAKNRKNLKLNVVIARAFLGKAPPGHVCDHIDRDKTNDAVRNLRYVSQSRNSVNSGRVDLASHVINARGTPRLVGQWRVALQRDKKHMMFGSYQSREYAEWVASFVKRHASLFFAA